MLFIPKKNKYKKQFKGKNFNKIFKNIKPFFFSNSLGLKKIEAGLLTSKHFETIRQAVKKILKKTGRITFFCFPQTPKTKKPLEIRMGKGKGNVSCWVFKAQIGSLICQINTSNKKQGIKALTAAQFRIPLKTKIINNV